MKRIITLLTMFLAIHVATFAQAPFTTYTPVQPVPRSNSSGYESFSVPSIPQPPTYSAPPQENLQTIAGYFVNNRGAFEKIRLKVNVVSASRVYLRGYIAPNGYGNWSYANSLCTEITRYSNDAAVIKGNFDYKCYGLNVGWVYF